MANLQFLGDLLADPSATGSVSLESAWESPSKAEMELKNPFSSKQVNWAGEYLARPQSEPDPSPEKSVGEILLDLGVKVTGYLAATIVAGQWRSSHVYPLRMVSTFLRRHARMIDSSALLSRRLKRMEAIILKLQRFPDMKLSTMHDIGGCRAILDSIKQVNELKDYYKANVQSGLGEPPPKEYDYISTPKDDGYRGIHLAVRFKPKPQIDMPSRRIEIQIRTRLQHQWATAVETVDFFTKQTMKLGGGDPRWKRFFVLVGSMFAAKEYSPLVPNTPATLLGLANETLDLWHELNVLKLMKSWSAAMNFVMDYPASAKFPQNSMCLIELDVQAGTTTLHPFRYEQLHEAQDRYGEIEKEIADDPNRSVVLVSVDSLADLKAAYPSYYGDTGEFIQAVAFMLATTEKPLV